MTFDDGLIKIYNVTNVSNNGDIPKKGLALRESAYFQELHVGVTRHYEAIKAGVEIGYFIGIHFDVDVDTDCIVVINDENKQYRIERIENDFDEEGLRIKKLTLVSSGVEHYEIVESTDTPC